MSVVVDIRNPQDLTGSYDQIEIQRNTINSASGMADIKTDLAISLTFASDLSTGYTSYTDPTGVVGTHYYRFRYKNSTSGAVSSYSDIFAAASNVLHTRFRRMMRDTNSNNYFFTADDLDFFLEQAISKLWPITWFETYSTTDFVPDGTTKIFTFPVGVTRVNSIDNVDSQGVTLEQIVNWKVRGRMLIFDQAPASGTIMRVWEEKMFIKLGEIPFIWDSHILNLMRLQAFETLEADRSKYYKYNSIAKPEGGNLPSLDRIITRIETQIKLREAQLRRVRRPAFIKLV